ncbi:MAG: hypothetical protein WEE53_00670, partial [Acidimicrobiia bacterium]
QGSLRLRLTDVVIPRDLSRGPESHLNSGVPDDRWILSFDVETVSKAQVEVLLLYEEMMTVEAVPGLVAIGMRPRQRG